MRSFNTVHRLTLRLFHPTSEPQHGQALLLLSKPTDGHRVMDHIFDHNLLRQRRLRALGAFEPGADFLVRRVAEDMADRLAVVERHFEHPVLVHGGLPHAAEHMRAIGKTADFKYVDLCAVPGVKMS